MVQERPENPRFPTRGDELFESAGYLTNPSRPAGR